MVAKKTETKHIKTNQKQTITTLPTSDKCSPLSRARQTHALPLGPPSELSTLTYVATSRPSGKNALKEAVRISQGQTVFIS